MRRISSTLKCMLVLSSVLIFSACSTYVRTTVSTFQGETALPQSAKVFIAYPQSQSEDVDPLEFNYFSDRLASNLNARGYHVVAAEQADYKVELSYSVGRINARRRNTSVGYGADYGLFRRNSKRSIAFVGSTGRINSDIDQFERRIHIRFSENTQDNTQIVSLSAVSYGRCEHMGNVFDNISNAILDNLYRPSGSILSVKSPNKQSCTL